MKKILKPVPNVEELRYNGTPDKPDIKIFVSHRIDMDSEIIDNPLYIPVRCGAVYDKREEETMLGDDTGDNISEKRMSYCELTVQYWAWKNIKADYYGLCHYRRYLSFSAKKISTDQWKNINLDYLNQSSIKKLNLFEGPMRELISKYDFIISEPYKTEKSIYEQYKEAPALHIEDLDKCLQILSRLYPEYTEASQKYIHGKKAYPCNMFIMKKELFEIYSEWLFSILHVFEEENNFKDYGNEAYRTPGHLGERLLGIFFTHLQLNYSQYRIYILQRAFFWNVEKAVLPKPAFEKNNIPIMMTCSDYFVPYAATTLLSIVKSSSNHHNYDIIFLYSDLSKQSKNLLMKVLEKHSNFSIQFFCMASMLNDYNFAANNHISVETFNRLFAQMILKHYEKVVYLDSDLIVKRNIADLFYTDIGNNLIGATHDADWLSQYNGAVLAVKPYCKKTLHLKDPFSYFQAGVLILNIREMNRTFSPNELADFANTKNFMYLDQDILNVKCQGKVFFVDMSWNVLISCGGQRQKNIETYAPRHIAQQYEDARKNPYIIHYAGYLKPWNEPSEDFSFEFWECARASILYEILLARMGSNIAWNTTAAYLGSSQSDFRIRLKMVLKRISFVFLPLGSKRREKIKMLYWKLKK